MQKRWVADLVLLSITFIWGVTFVVVQEAIRELPPLAFNGVRFTIASLFLLGVLAFFFREQLKQVNRKMVSAGVLLGILLFAGYAFQTVGLVTTTPSKAGFITGLSVVLVPVFAIFMLKEKLKPFVLIGVFSATVGLYLLTLGNPVAMNIGDFYVFLCAISFALQILVTGKYAPQFPALPLALIQISTVAVLALLFSPILETGWSKMIDPPTLLHPAVFWALIVTAIPATALAFVAQTQFQRYTTSSRVALIFVMEPVFAAVADIWTSGKMIGAKPLLGCLLILLGMLFAELNPDLIPGLKQLRAKKRLEG